MTNRNCEISRQRVRSGRITRTRLPVLLLGGMSVLGCDGFLEKPPLSAIASDQFYQTEQQATAAVNAVYDVLTPMHRQNGMMSFGDAAANTLNLSSSDTWIEFEEHRVIPTNSLILQLWNQTFEGINRANAVIDRLPGAQIAPALNDRLTGEARFLRAYYYFNAVRIWGGVPMPLTESTSLEGLDQARASEDQVYAQIVQDLETAIVSLPLTAPQAGRATQGAARALLAKVHLTRGNFAEARAEALQVMNLGKYGLWDRYEDVFKLVNENGKEDLFSVQFETGIGEGQNYPVWSLPDELKPVVAGGGGVTRTHFRIDDDLIASYEPGDTRAALNVVNSYTLGGKTYTWDVPLSFKYHDGMLVNNVNDMATNWPVLRYADVLLMFAEAENELSGPTAAAYDAINQVRRRAYGVPLNQSSEHDLSGLSQDAFREAVLKERFHEFPVEAQQWFDLKRTGRLVPVLGIEAFRTLFPIPQRELEVNRNLEQNAGY